MIMLKFISGFISGVYVAQEFKKEVPDITKIVNGIRDDIKKKMDEYNNDKK